MCRKQNQYFQTSDGTREVGEGRGVKDIAEVFGYKN